MIKEPNFGTKGSRFDPCNGDFFSDDGHVRGLIIAQEQVRAMPSGISSKFTVEGLSLHYRILTLLILLCAFSFSPRQIKLDLCSKQSDRARHRMCLK